MECQSVALLAADTAASSYYVTIWSPAFIHCLSYSDTMTHLPNPIMFFLTYYYWYLGQYALLRFFFSDSLNYGPFFVFQLLSAMALAWRLWWITKKCLFPSFPLKKIQWDTHRDEVWKYSQTCFERPLLWTTTCRLRMIFQALTIFLYNLPLL